MDDPSLMSLSLRTYSKLYGNGTVPYTFTRSSYHETGETVADISHFSASRNESIGIHFVGDSIATRLMAYSSGLFVSLYTGTLQDLLFIECPGVGELNITNYDWTQDPESQPSLDDPDEVVTSAPYRDPYEQLSEISFYRGWRDFANWQVSGIAGADIALSMLQPVVAQVQFSNVSRTGLFDTATNTIIIDSEPLAGDELVSNTDTLQSLFQGATAAGTNASYLITDNDYLYVSQLMVTNNYVLVVRVPESFISSVMTQISANSQHSAKIVSVSFIVSVFGAILLASWILVREIDRRTAPLPLLASQIETIPKQHLGAANHLKGIAQVPPPTPMDIDIVEMQRLLAVYEKIVPAYNASRVASEQYPKNPHFKGTPHVFDPARVGLGSVVSARLLGSASAGSAGSAGSNPPLSSDGNNSAISIQMTSVVAPSPIPAASVDNLPVPSEINV